MKKHILIWIIYIFSVGLQAQERLYVWNIMGTEAKDEPSQQSRTLKKLYLGESIQLAHFTDGNTISTSKSSLGGYILKGSWLRVEIDNAIGFVFDGDLSPKSPPVYEKEGRFVIDHQRILGDKTRDTVLVEKIRTQNRDIEVKENIDFFEFGSYSYKAFDSCFDHVYFFNQVQLNEVFFIAMSEYCLISNEKFILPEFSEEDKGEIKFIGLDATEELVIKKTERGWQISSYECT